LKPITGVNFLSRKGTIMAAIEIDSLLAATVKNGGSDLHLRVGSPPRLRIRGHLRSLGNYALTADDTLALMQSITSEKHQSELQGIGGADFSIAYQDIARFRVSVFRHKGVIGLVLRQIPNTVLSFEQMGIPLVIRELCSRPRGMILVTGPTGSGKTTSLCSMINFINETRQGHVITIEDPIEFVHQHKKCIVTQREIGSDVPSFSEALRRALRQDPDIILVGEMRDLETIDAAVTAAETGHLVLGTLHTTSAAKTINRLIDAFPTQQQEQIRAQLSVSLLAVLCQTLLPTADGKGRVAAYELMICTPEIQNLIRENETFKMDSIIQTNSKMGMVLLDDFLFNLYASKQVRRDEAILKANYPDQLELKIDRHNAQLESERMRTRK
jgi:twitching motility protein PilT